MRRLTNSALMVLLGLIVINAVSGIKAWAYRSSDNGTGSGEFTIEMLEVSGLAEVRSDTYSRWQKPVVGNRLQEGAQIRLGPRSFVKIRTSSGKTLTIDRLGTFGVQREMDDGKIPGYLRQVRGPMRYDIAEGGIVHESVIHSPSTTFVTCRLKVSISSDSGLATFKSVFLVPIKMLAKAFHFPL